MGFFSSSVGSNGCLYANIVDTNFVSHEIYSAPGLLQSNVYQHVALTFNTNSGIAALYLNGTNVATTNLFTNGVSFVPKTDGDLLLGRDMTLYTNNYYGGQMDEMSLYSRALSDAEIIAIYQASAFTTNRLLGKFDPRVTPAVGLAEAAVVFGSASNVIFGVNNQWQVNSYTFTATSNSMPLRITGLEPGILLDSFNVSEAPLTNLYYLPEAGAGIAHRQCRRRRLDVAGLGQPRRRLCHQRGPTGELAVVVRARIQCADFRHAGSADADRQHGGGGQHGLLSGERAGVGAVCHEHPGFIQPAGGPAVQPDQCPDRCQSGRRPC
jgi:hypothetical protein